VPARRLGRRPGAHYDDRFPHFRIKAVGRLPSFRRASSARIPANNAAIMSVLCLIIAAKLIGDGISALA
jgi:hypothetical protein